MQTIKPKHTDIIVSSRHKDIIDSNPNDLMVTNEQQKQMKYELLNAISSFNPKAEDYQDNIRYIAKKIQKKYIQMG